MDSNEKKELSPPLSILQRLDNLDRLLLFLEEKYCLSSGHSNSNLEKFVKSEERCKSMSSALEEAHHKGTLMERVAHLESRVIQLSLEMDEGNTSRSSSSTTALLEKLGHGSGCSVQHEDPIHPNQDPCKIKERVCVDELACSRKSQCCKSYDRPRKRASLIRYRKWLIRWFPIGC